ncbi:hypothetical protein [Enterobacter roggenkampii]|uniref:hypothetical protein n=1 Tax=Enterobacter roggenkampii TaxID=1812935 RepID=UPI000FCC5D89|nr:hypothetical protein [Enterobacter roggenkampii]
MLYRNKLIATAMLLSTGFCLKVSHAGVTIASSTKISVPVIFKPGMGAGDQRGINKLMFAAYGGDFNNVHGNVTVQINTTDGSTISTKLDICNLGEQVCWDDPSSWADVDIFDGATVTNPVRRKLSSLTANGILTNTSGHDVMVQYSLDYKNESDTGSTASNYLRLGSVTIPAQTVCSLDINTPLNIGNITPGQSTTSLPLANNASGEGNITFKPDNADSSGGVLKNANGNLLRYSIEDSESKNIWNATDIQYHGNILSDYTFRLENVPNTVAPGEYSGTLTATISCN